jgi:guanosine-3',5'-bis(diphosphate) 3'-pyrophosphohydrolase
MSDLDKAIQLAARIHARQKDRYGRPYILHPLRVMMRVRTDQEKIVAILHDVVEDSDLEAKDLTKEGFSPEIVAAVDCLSKRDGEVYQDYIKRVLPNPLARTVKLADLEDNMNLERVDHLEEKDFQRFTRYHRAWLMLKNAE